ncbi:MAG: stage IV sporulation protein A [Candidatus Coprovivens sp.]
MRYHKNRSYWFDEEIPFVEAAEIGTEKVIKDHSTIGIVITSDGSFGELKREDYIEAETKVITELKTINKPFIVVLNTTHPNADMTRKIADDLNSKYDVPVLPISVENMSTIEINEILKETLYEFEIDKITISIPEWVHVLNNEHYVKKEYLEKIRTSTYSIKKLKDVDNILEYYKDSTYITNAYISEVDYSTGIVNVCLDTNDEIYNQVLNELMDTTLSSKASMIKVFASYKESKEETESIKKAIKEAKQTGYGIVYPTLKDMDLSIPEVLKQGNRFGIKLKATASSYHIIRADVISSFEPIIGSELQSKELINYLMKDYETDHTNIWRSEIFGRSLDNIVKEGIQSKLSLIPENTKYKLSQTVTKIVNKGSNNLIAIVI